MRDIIIIPTLDRPEFLQLCLERIAACPEAKELDVWIVADRGALIDEVRRVVGQFQGTLRGVLIERHQHAYVGNSYNVLEAYREAYISGAEFVFQIEDDVLIASQFFSWHYRSQAENVEFCSIAAKQPKNGGYCSWGVCFRREMLNMILPHANARYYADPQRYCYERFPGSRLMEGYAEQDGLIYRVWERSGLPIGFASPPQAQHCGWYGYHRHANRPVGTLAERYEQVKRVLSTPGKLEMLCATDYADLESVHV